MDQCYEHLISIKNDARTITLLIVSYVILLFFCVAAYFLGGPLAIIVIAAAIYFAVQITKNAMVEFEYIFTNGEIDVDIIIGKSKRNRITSFKCNQITEIKKGVHDIKSHSVYCNKDSKEAYAVKVQNDSGSKTITMEIPEKMRDMMLPFMNKLVARDAFKEQ